MRTTSSSIRSLAILLALSLLLPACGGRRSGSRGGDDDDSVADDDDFVADDDDTAPDDDDVAPDDDDVAPDDDDVALDDDDVVPDDDDVVPDDDDTAVDDDDDTALSDLDSDGWDSSQDCDDYDASVHPGAPELCDGQDNDCSGAPGSGEVDSDGDLVMICEGDCDDFNASAYPSAPELCDGADNNCDSSVGLEEQDSDADGVRGCEGDCDDFDASVYPGAPEVCGDFVDQDCDGADLDCGPGSCPADTDVEFGGRCYYLDGSGGSCEAGYELAPQSILSSIAADFVGKDYKNTDSENCCIQHIDEPIEGQDWGLPGPSCNQPGPFADPPELGGSDCTDAHNTYSLQLTLCRSI